VAVCNGRGRSGIVIMEGKNRVCTVSSKIEGEKPKKMSSDNVDRALVTGKKRLPAM